MKKVFNVNYWVGKVSTQISQNFQAWATHVESFDSKLEATAFASNLENADWENVPEGCHLGYTYLVFEDEMELGYVPATEYTSLKGEVLKHKSRDKRKR